MNFGRLWRLSAALAAAFLLLGQAAWAQAITQSGPILNGGGHVPMYLPGGFGTGLASVMDSGPASGGAIGYGLSEKLLQARAPGTGPFGAHDCDWDTYATNPAGAHYLCFDANANGGGLIAYGAIGGAAQMPFTILQNGTPILSGNGLLAFPYVLVTAPPYNAKCNGVADDTAAIQSALSGGAKNVVGPPGVICYVGNTLNVPDGVSFSWGDFNASPNGQTSGLLCGAALCIQAGANDNGTPNVDNIVLYRKGTPTGSTCIQWYGDYNVTAERLWCQGFAIPFQIYSSGVTGIQFHGSYLYSCGTSDADVDVITEPGVYISQSWFGCDGAFDLTSNDFLRIEGNWDNTKGTVHLNDVQFNKGQNTAVCAIDLKNFTGTTNTFFDLSVIGGHTETAQNFLCSDSTTKGLSLFSMVGQWPGGGWGGGNHFFNLNAATTINSWTLTADQLTGWADVTLAPSAQINDLKMTGISFLMPINITGAGSSSIDLMGNTYDGVTLSGSFGSASVSGVMQAGAFTNSASGSVAANFPGANQNSLTPCSLSLQVGGSSAGITYTQTPVCQWSLSGNYATVSIYISVTSLGGLTGTATLAGLPFTATGSNIGGSALYNPGGGSSGWTGVSGGIVGLTGAATKTINLYTQGSTGQTVITNANFSASGGTPAILAGTITYPVAAMP